MNSKVGISKGATVVVIFFLVGLGVLLLSRDSSDFRTAESKSLTNISNVFLMGNSVRVNAIHEVVLTEDGFSPEEMSIHVGDTIVFRSTRGEFFWPASNLHPTHLLYPEFDPREPIAKDETWSFRFDRVGEWKYHDHLAPYYTGTIIVTTN